MVEKDFDYTEINSFEELSNVYSNIKKIKIPQIIEKAFIFSETKHKGQKRVVTGQDYIIHPLTIAKYVVQLDLDDESIIAALLHDTVEDTNTSIDEIDKIFGTDVAFLVDSLTSVTDVSDIASEGELIDSEIINTRKIVIKAAEDVRVIIIKICDKIHNLITQSEDKKVKSALKAKRIWEPLAEYVGLHVFKRKLQDEIFKILHPVEYSKANEHIEKIIESDEPLFEEFQLEVKKLLHKYNIENYKLTFRIKSVSSFYEKLKRKQKAMTIEDINFNDLQKVRDIFGIRIIVNDIQNCYMILGLLHSKFQYVKEEFDDYIVKPRPNGYRSIHTLLKFHKIYVETQIRTFEMHEMNEYGPASHFAYKEKTVKPENFIWVKELESGSNSKGKLKAFENTVFVFTPKNKIIILKDGSTPIDFAYSVHSDIGNHFIGAKVNGKIVEKSYIFKTGDICEILTSPNAKPNRDWLSFVKMARVRQMIRRKL